MYGYASNTGTDNYMTFTWSGDMRAIYKSGNPIVSQPFTRKNTASLPIGDFIGMQSSLTLDFGANLNGEFKEMIVVKTGNSSEFISSVSQTFPLKQPMFRATVSGSRCTLT